MVEVFIWGVHVVGGLNVGCFCVCVCLGRANKKRPSSERAHTHTHAPLPPQHTPTRSTAQHTARHHTHTPEHLSMRHVLERHVVRREVHADVFVAHHERNLGVVPGLLDADRREVGALARAVFCCCWWWCGGRRGCGWVRVGRVRAFCCCVFCERPNAPSSSHAHRRPPPLCTRTTHASTPKEREAPRQEAGCCFSLSLSQHTQRTHVSIEYKPWHGEHASPPTTIDQCTRSCAAG